MRERLERWGHHPRLRHTVWANGALDDVQPRFRNVFRLFLPTVDVILIIMGVIASIVSSAALGDLVLPWFGLVWSSLLALAGFIALIGVVFMFDRLELWAKGALVLLFLIYITALGFYGISGRYASWISMAVMLVSLMVVLGRIIDLVNQIARKEFEAEQLAKRLAS